MATPTAAKDAIPINLVDLLKELETAPLDTIFNLRNRYADSMAAQIKLAPLEHRAFAREYTAAHPAAAPVMAVLPIAYAGIKADAMLAEKVFPKGAAIAKLLGAFPIDEMTTPPSIEQITAGIAGVGEGLQQAFTGAFK